MGIFSLLFLFCLLGVDSSLEEETNILYQRDAVASGGAVELINNTTSLSHVGQAMYADQSMQIWYPRNIRKYSSCRTHFNHANDTQSCPNHASGLAFLLSPVVFQIPLNSADGFLGLNNKSSSDLVQYYLQAVHLNPLWLPLNELVQNNTNSTISSSDVAGVRFHSGRCSAPVRIFRSWNSSSTLSINNTSTGTKKAKVILALNTSSAVTVAVLLSLTILLIIVCIIVWYKRRRWTARKASEAANSLEAFDDLEGAGPREFSYQYLAAATNNFSNEQKLGEGGFGCVYKGYLTDLEMHIAVKKISRGSRQGKKEYVTEVKIISRLRHRNILQLIGWCHDHGHFLLAYEYMPNRSLDVHLFGSTNSLVWQVRYKITLGLASALHYLQEECEPCVVHRDIKASNIMLDSNFNLKLGDFGLARLMGNELVLQTTEMAGTFGYLAPEYVNTGVASKGSDIYSFGMVILEIVTGRRSRDAPENAESARGLLEWVWNLYGCAELVSAVDRKLNTEFDTRQVECLMIVGLWCAHPDHNLRPLIRQAIQALNFEVELPILPTKMPVPLYQLPLSISTPAASSSEASMTFTSINVGR